MAPASAVPHPRNAFLFVGTIPAREGTYGLQITRMVIHFRYVQSTLLCSSGCNFVLRGVHYCQFEERKYESIRTSQW